MRIGQADASLTAFARRILGKVPKLFQCRKIRCHIEQRTMRLAPARHGCHWRWSRSRSTRRNPDFGGGRQMGPSRARRGAATTGSRQNIKATRGSGSPITACAILNTGNAGGDPGSSNPREGRKPAKRWTHGRGFGQYHRWIVPGAMDSNRLQARAVRRAGNSSDLVVSNQAEGG